jgi:intracellular sulfur oxidation DsrE/DsrF family protein
MKKLFLTTTCLVLIALFAQAQKDYKPPIEGFGKMYEVSFAEDKPDPSLDYKIIVEAGEKIENPAELFAPLEHVARMYNLHIYGGVPQKQLDVALMIWGVSIPVVMNNEAYRKKFGVDNPNIKIIEAMKSAGIKIFACGQSIMKNSIDPQTVNPDVTIALSRFTTVSTYQLKGYAFFKY